MFEQFIDLINGSFEMLGAIFISMSIWKLSKDREVKGVSWLHASYFTAWGFWNLFYYPSLGQTFSFIGGIGIVITNTIWVGMLIYFSRKLDKGEF